MKVKDTLGNEWDKLLVMNEVCLVNEWTITNVTIHMNGKYTNEALANEWNHRMMLLFIQMNNNVLL